ncbi:hypothetical protein ACIA5C_37565 [Actinoplanes sp. NPDC051343]|uniref:hypothetical protein n=1 Tax=Actinoplanes sp. NPDC051343 TaxID=3363906 RepID=UPI00379CA0F2
MKYDELEAAILQLVRGADDDTLRRFGAETVARLVREELLLDMDPGLLTMISALEHWTTYLETGQKGELYELAIRSIEQVDFHVSADLSDFLAKPEMAAEYERIERLLTA